jgi:hypothetical protein
MAEKRWPVHLAVFAGLSAGAYAGSLAVVAMLQSAIEMAAIAERAPVGAAADAIAAVHDDLDARVADAERRLIVISDRYGALVPEFALVETSLDGLATTTSSVTDSARTLPSRVTLPKVVSAPRIVRVAAPKAHATTGASGG